MRFALLHKIASYLLAASGFSALALSGELSPVVIALTLSVGAVSFFLEPSQRPALRGATWTLGWNVTSLLVFALAALLVLRGEPFLLVGAQALCFLMVNKLCNRRASRDYLQVYVLSFLMLVAGTTLNTDLAFAPCFLAYVISATWAFTLLHLRREMEDNLLLKHTGDTSSERVEVERVLGSRRVVGGTFLAVTSVMSAAIFLVSGTFFFLFPRFGWNVFFRHARHGLSVGFNDKGVNLGDNGLLVENNQVVMRVEFPGGRPQKPVYFRGISFERYEEGRWTPTPALKDRPLRRWGGMTVVGEPLTRAPFEASEFRERLKRSVKQDIYLEPMESTVLFAASQPVALALQIRDLTLNGTEVPRMHVVGKWAERDGPGGHYAHPTSDVFAERIPGGVRYQAFSLLEPPGPAELARSSAPSPEEAIELADYLSIDGVSPRVRELGRRLTERASSPIAKVEAVMRHLRGGFQYTTRLEHDARKEPVEEFLFDRRQGHCEYFASSLALLLRAAGVPTRHVAGFYGGEWNQVGNYLQIRQRDAHAWVEAWMGDEVGWVRFDATPAAVGGEAQGGLGQRIRQMLDVVELAWFKYVIEYDLATQLDLLSRARRWLQSAGNSGSGALLGQHGERKLPIKVLISSLLVALLAAGLYIAWRKRPGEGRSSPRRAAQATRAIEKAMRALEKRGCERTPADTPRQLLVRARALGDPAVEPYEALVALYYASRFGAEEVAHGELSRLAALVVRPPDAGAPAGRASDGFDPSESHR